MLTNSLPETLQAQIANAGLRDRFDALLSVDAVRHTSRNAKHTIAPPKSAASRPMVCCSWQRTSDVLGAMRTGARGAFVARPGQVLIPNAPVPEIVAPTFTEMTEQLVTRYGT